MLAACGGQTKEQKTAKTGLTEGDIAVGMTFTDFKTIFPSVTLSPDGQWVRDSDIYGLDGKWIYSFSDNKLAWYVFNAFNRIFQRKISRLTSLPHGE